jgi:hypothetical protein
MAGRVLGKHYRELVDQLLVHSQAEPAFIAGVQAELEAIDPDTERPWAEYTATLAKVADTVRRQALVTAGQAIVRRAKPEFEAWGFDTAEKVLADWDAPFGSMIIDAPEEQSVITLKYQVGQAYLRAGAVLPAPLIEGYIRGVLEVFGGELLELACHRVAMDGLRYHLFEVRWRANAVPRTLPRRASDRMALGMRSPLGVPQKVA